jgi:hypothetical protein
MAVLQTPAFPLRHLAAAPSDFNVGLIVARERASEPEPADVFTGSSILNSGKTLERAQSDTSRRILASA